MEIKAAVTFEQSAEFRIEKVQLSEPNDDEVLVRIVAAGICHTDLAARDQHLPVPLPSVLGHEGAGIVEKGGGAGYQGQAWRPCGLELDVLRQMPRLQMAGQ